MATSKALRATPPKDLNNYIASIKKTLDGPKSVADDKFVNFLFESTAPETAAGTKATIPLGFSLEFSQYPGYKYKYVTVSRAGWAALVDTSDASIESDIITGGDVTDNSSIKSTFTKNHILLAPWFDNQSSVAENIDQLKTGGSYATLSTYQISSIKKGEDEKDYPYDRIDRGVRYLNYFDPAKGKCLLVRWTNSQVNYGKKFKFEVAIFESGKFEFRYWQTTTYTDGDSSPTSSTATVGIFWSGPDTGANKFRDFAQLLDYRKDTSRPVSPLGGASYSASYTENSVGFSNLISESYWPKNGAVISYTCPVNLVKFLPKKLARDISSNRIVREKGMYDDRKTISFFTGSVDGNSVYMPSTLGTRLQGDTGDTDIELLQLLIGHTGSISVPGNQQKNTIDSLLQQVAVFDSNKSKNNSFNESQKNYRTSITSSAFYSNESSLSLFGEGFSSPLSSKTQFYLSLPVNKQSVMPTTSSAVYYYDAYKKGWVVMDSSGYRQPESTSLAIAGELDEYYFYRVTETSKGFDAVGRKIVSGSKNADLDPSTAGYGSNFQTDAIIGTLFNRTISASYSQISVQDALNKSYRNSITDNPKFFPDSSKQIQFSVDEPFLIEKVVVNLPLYANNEWFKDVTSCNRAYGDSTPVDGVASGAIDFGGPGLTFSIFCPRKSGNVTYMDLITSGTITHHIDNKSEVLIKKDPDQKYYSIRPVGFLAFSNPTAVVSGVWNGSQHVFDGKVKLEMEASVAGGVTFARNDRSQKNTNADYVKSNVSKAESLLTTKELPVDSGETYNAFDIYDVNATEYKQRSARVYIQQVSPLARGTSRQEFNGNSILGGNIAYANVESTVKNPLYVSESLSKLPSEFQTILSDPTFNFDAVSIYSTVDSRPSPYLVMPGDKLTFCISKTRPVIDRMALSNTRVTTTTFYDFQDYILTGSHDAVVLNTGSIDVTIYGSYVREGVEYHR